MRQSTANLDKMKTKKILKAEALSSEGSTDDQNEKNLGGGLGDSNASTDIPETVNENTKTEGGVIAKKEAKRIRRRTKGQNLGRNFICGCGKQYLSYPALYTHIKTKHEHRARSDEIALYKRNPTTNLLEQKEAPEKEKNVLEDSSNLKSIEYIVVSHDFIEKIVLEEDLQILKILDGEVRGKSIPNDGFPCYRMCTSTTPRFHPFLHLFHKLRTESLDKSIMINPKCDMIFCIYLLGVCRFFSPTFYRIVGVFFRNLRECLNEEGYRFCEGSDVKIEPCIEEDFIKMEENFEEKRGGPQDSYHSCVPKSFCTSQSPRIIPKCANYFISEYLPVNCEKFDQDLAVYLMIDFCRWLNKHHLTHIKIELYGDVFV